jgi:hypothetical protein
MCFLTLNAVIFSFAIGNCAPAPASSCPPLIQYSPAIQRQAAQDLRALPEKSALATIIVDAKRTRDAIRACQGK